MASATAPTFAPTSRFALEIYMIIISYLSSSKGELDRMSLVCKSWLPLCRFHLFNEVIYQDTFAAFLVASPHAIRYVAPHVRKVTFRGHYSTFQQDCDHRRSFFRLTRVNHIQIEHFSINDDIFQSISQILAISKVSAINLRSLHFASFGNFAKLIERVDTSLRSLSIDGVSWDPIPRVSADLTHSERVPVGPSSLQIISVKFSNTRIFLNWLAYGVPSTGIVPHEQLGSRRNFPKLSRLCITDILAEEASTVGIFLSGAGDSLEHVELGVAAHDLRSKNTDLLSKIRLDKNSLLKRIVFHGVNLFQFPSFTEDSSDKVAPVAASVHTWIPGLLSSIHASGRVEVRMHLWFCTEDQLDTFPWCDLDDALSARPSQFNMDFRLSGIGWADTDVIKAWFTKRMLKTDASTITVNLDGFE